MFRCRKGRLGCEVLADRMYEELEDIARLKFGKQLEMISTQTHEKIREAKRQFAATAGPVRRSGQHDAQLAQLRLEGVEQMARALFEIWVDLIKQRNGHIVRADIDFVANKISEFVNAQAANLNKIFVQEGGLVASSMVQQTSMRVYAMSASARRDLEIMAREFEAFPKRPEEISSMKEIRRKRFSQGRRVLVGMGLRPGTVQSVANAPSTLGEFVHEVLVDGEPQVLRVLGSELQPIPELDEDLRGGHPTIHIHNSNVANLNLGSQVGTIHSNLQAISQGGAAQQEFARAIEQLTEAVITETGLQQDQKQEVVDVIATISDQAAKKPEQRSKGTLKAALAWFPTGISAASNLVSLWDKLGPIIKAHLGF